MKEPENPSEWIANLHWELDREKREGGYETKPPSSW